VLGSFKPNRYFYKERYEVGCSTFTRPIFVHAILSKAYLVW